MYLQYFKVLQIFFCVACFFVNKIMIHIPKLATGLPIEQTMCRDADSPHLPLIVSTTFDVILIKQIFTCWTGGACQG